MGLNYAENAKFTFYLTHFEGRTHLNLPNPSISLLFTVSETSYINGLIELQNHP